MPAIKTLALDGGLDPFPCCVCINSAAPNLHIGRSGKFELPLLREVKTSSR